MVVKSPWLELGVGSLLTLVAVVVFRAGRRTRVEPVPARVDTREPRRATPPGEFVSEVGPDGVPLSAYAG